MTATVVFLAAFGGALILQAGDWPQWRGPHRDGISSEKGLSKSWPAGGPKLLWHNNSIGAGYSTPSVVGNHLYLLSNEGLENEFVAALATSNGREVWSTPIGKVGKPDQRPNYPAARSTPTLDGDRLYALGSDGDLACLDAATGKKLWAKNLLGDFEGDSGEWAYSESPMVDGDLVICTPGGASSMLLALNKMTGNVVWKCAAPEGSEKAGYSSMVLVEIGGVRQIVQFLEKGLIGVEVKTGKPLWRYARTAEDSPALIPTPVARGNLVYSGGARVGGGLARITHSANGFAAEEVYFSNKLPTAIGGAVLVGDHLYGAASQSLLCVDFETGEIQWEERSAAPGSLIAVDGNLILHGESGEVALLQATAEGYREQGRFTPPNPPDRGQSKAWAYPVVAEGRLYLRDWTSLWSYDLRAQ